MYSHRVPALRTGLFPVALSGFDSRLGGANAVQNDRLRCTVGDLDRSADIRYPQGSYMQKAPVRFSVIHNDQACPLSTERFTKKDATG